MNTRKDLVYLLYVFGGVSQAYIPQIPAHVVVSANVGSPRGRLLRHGAQRGPGGHVRDRQQDPQHPAARDSVSRAHSRRVVALG